MKQIVFLIVFANIFGFQLFSQDLDNAVKIKVCDIESGQPPSIEQLGPFKEFAESSFRNYIKDCSAQDSNRNFIYVQTNSFLHALHFAYTKHYSFSISPDMVWLLICQGVSLHINKESEKYRNLFVNHQAKEMIEIRRNDFQKGVKNDWSAVFPEFTEKIISLLKDDIYKIFIHDFSTTGQKEKIAYQITLMETMQSYFSYGIASGCGIPEIYLEGTTDDWIWIRENIEILDNYGLKFWKKSLIPVIDEFISASKGNADARFWNKIYKFKDLYDEVLVNGWIIKFFPYYIDSSKSKKNVTDYFELFKKNGKLKNTKYKRAKIRMAQFPSGLANVDFKWKLEYFDPVQTIDMKFSAGFIGAKYFEDKNVIRAEIGWIVIEK